MKHRIASDEIGIYFYKFPHFTNNEHPKERTKIVVSEVGRHVDLSNIKLIDSEELDR